MVHGDRRRWIWRYLRTCVCYRYSCPSHAHVATRSRNAEGFPLSLCSIFRSFIRWFKWHLAWREQDYTKLYFIFIRQQRMHRTAHTHTHFSFFNSILHILLNNITPILTEWSGFLSSTSSRLRPFVRHHHQWINCAHFGFVRVSSSLLLFVFHSAHAARCVVPCARARFVNIWMMSFRGVLVPGPPK